MLSCQTRLPPQDLVLVLNIQTRHGYRDTEPPDLSEKVLVLRFMPVL